MPKIREEKNWIIRRRSVERHAVGACVVYDPLTDHTEDPFAFRGGRSGRLDRRGYFGPGRFLTSKVKIDPLEGRTEMSMRIIEARHNGAALKIYQACSFGT